MTKSKTGLVTRCDTYPATDTLPVRVIPRIFPLIPLVTHLLPLSILNRYLTRDSHGNFFFFFTTAWRNISVVRYGLSLVTILLLDLAKIHWIQWIQRNVFKENSMASHFCVMLNNILLNLFLLNWANNERFYNIVEILNMRGEEVIANKLASVLSASCHH